MPPGFGHIIKAISAATRGQLESKIVAPYQKRINIEQKFREAPHIGVNETILAPIGEIVVTRKVYYCTAWMARIINSQDSRDDSKKFFIFGHTMASLMDFGSDKKEKETAAQALEAIRVGIGKLIATDPKAEAIEFTYGTTPDMDIKYYREPLKNLKLFEKMCDEVAAEYGKKCIRLHPTMTYRNSFCDGKSIQDCGSFVLSATNKIVVTAVSKLHNTLQEKDRQ